MGMQIAGWLGAALLLAGSPVAMAAAATGGSNPPLRALMESDRRFLEQIGPPEPVAEQRAPQEPLIDPQTATHFLQAYIKAASHADVEAEATYFADTVEFYERGKLSHKALRRELAKARKAPREPQAWMGLQGLRPEGADTVKARFAVWKGGRAEPKRTEVHEAIIRRLPSGGAAHYRA